MLTHMSGRFFQNILFHPLPTMTLKERYAACLEYWQKENPNPGTELQYSNHFELLVAVMLSAQCTDKRINMVTPALFAAYPTAEAMARATFDEVFALVKSVSYPNSKTRHLIEMAQMLVNEFHGEIPDSMEEMTRLPGVGRKTANVMLGQAFGKAAIAVDTHVFRVANRIGLSNGKTPLEVEKSLAKHIAPQLQWKAHHWILLHGRYVCKAQKPDCLNCAIKAWCKSYTKGHLER